jgi:hypothetical protein
MMKPSDDDRDDSAPLARLLSRPTGGGDAEDRLATLIRAGAPAVEGLGARARARVWSRLANSKRRLRTHAGLRWSVAASVLLTSGAVIGAVTAYSWWRAVPTEPALVEAPAQSRGRMRHTLGGRFDAPQTTGTLPPDATAQPAPLAPNALASPTAPSLHLPGVEAAEPRPGPATFPKRHRSVDAASRTPDVVAVSVSPSLPADALGVPPNAPRATIGVATADMSARSPEPPAAEAAPIPAAVTSVQRGSALSPSIVAPAPSPANAVEAPAGALSGEARLLTEALNRLRQKRDVAGAIATLDAYDARFPTGTLRGESARARVDALLMLGRDDDALVVLRSLALLPQGRDEELRVIRGELLARSSCESAIADFDRVLADAPALPLAERALHGRAGCLSRLGDREGAFRDWREYLQRYPEGRFAAEARLWLQSKNL